MRYFYVEPEAITGKKVLITEPDAGHIRKVLRLKPDDIIGLFDGSGFEYHARINEFTKPGIKAVIEARIECPTESPVHITLAQGFLKEKKMDELVRQLTELGINAWVPFMAARSVPNPDDKKLAKRVARWQTISKQSIKQCHRGRYMQVNDPVSYEDALEAAAGCDAKIVFWEDEKTPLKAIQAQFKDRQVQTLFVMIGPEGGLTEQEVALAKAAGFHVAGLGPRILRAETATIAACSLVQHVFGDLG